MTIEYLGFGGTKQLHSNIVVSGYIEHSGRFYHSNVASRTFSVSGGYNLAVSDSGYELRVTVSDVRLTLPAMTVSETGLRYLVVNTGEDGIANPKVAPNAVDMIVGCGLSGTDNKALINTQATAQMGDLIEVEGQGNLGWWMVRQYGTWALV